MTHIPAWQDAASRHEMVRTRHGVVVGEFNRAAIVEHIARMPVIDGQFAVGHLLCTPRALSQYLHEHPSEPFTRVSLECPFSRLHVLMFARGVLPDDQREMLQDHGFAILQSVTGRSRWDYVQGLTALAYERPKHVALS